MNSIETPGLGDIGKWSHSRPCGGLLLSGQLIKAIDGSRRQLRTLLRPLSYRPCRPIKPV